MDGGRGKQTVGASLLLSNQGADAHNVFLGTLVPPDNLCELCCLPKLLGNIPLFLILECAHWRDSPIVIASFFRSCGRLSIAVKVGG